MKECFEDFVATVCDGKWGLSVVLLWRNLLGACNVSIYFASSLCFCPSQRCNEICSLILIIDVKMRELFIQLNAVLHRVWDLCLLDRLDP